MKPEVELIELKAVATVESMEQRVETRVKPEVELIGLKVESAKQRAKTRLRPKVELMELELGFGMDSRTGLASGTET